MGENTLQLLSPPKAARRRRASIPQRKTPAADLQHSAEQFLAAENHILEMIAEGKPLRGVLDAVCRALNRLWPGTRAAIQLATEPGAAAGTPRSKHKLELLELPITTPGGELLGTLCIQRPAVAPGLCETGGATFARLAALAIERERGEKRSRQQLAQLAHLSRLATMGEMASGLAHELNQPLCAIVNYMEACVELIGRGRAGKQEIRQALAEVAKQAERAGEVIRRLRDFVRRREPQRDAVDLNSLVREMVELTGVETRQQDVRVVLELAAEPLYVLADRVQIQQVLVNLIRNALDALRTAPDANRVLTLQSAARGGMAEIAVSDSGAGLAERVRGKLFEPFFSTKPDGMGMGLSISRAIVEGHEGRIWADPSRCGGAIFRFILPLAKRGNP